MTSATLQAHLAVIGAGPAGLALALLAARRLPGLRITVFDARALDRDLSADARTLALSLGSVQMLERLGVWPAAAAQPITEVHVSQAVPALLPLPGGAPQLRIRAADEGVPLLGAVLPYGALVAPLQQAWLRRCADQPLRCQARFGTAVSALKPVDTGVEVDAGIAETFDLAVVAEGGVFGAQSRKALSHDYRQRAWVGAVTLDGGTTGLAVERFTANGPLALLPLPVRSAGRHQAAMVWCVDADDDPVEPLGDAQRIAVLGTLLPEAAGRIAAISPLERFDLGLNAELRLVNARTVRIGNAAQTLHPVGGQGLNLGLRDAYALVQALRDHGDVDAALRRVEWSRAPDRWSMIATTDFLARSFAWRVPGLASARAVGLAALAALPPLRSLLARHMMFGQR
ncbi:MAG: FAD-dependent monooxygenase [Burkholderiaceae bacterium]